MANVTLLEYQKLAKSKSNKLFLGLIEDLIRKWDVWSILPSRQVTGLSVKGSRWNTLPSVAFRKINAAYSATKGTTEDIEETLTMLGGEIIIDRVLTKVKDTVQNPLEVQMDMISTAMTLQMAYSLINGNQGENVDSFDGIKIRVSNMPARCTIYLDSDHDGTNTRLPVLYSSANRQEFLDAVHQAVLRTNATHLLMNESTYEGFGRIFRREGLMDTTQDQYGRTWDAIQLGSRKIPLVDVGLKNDKSTEVIPNDEDPGDGGNDATSLYAVRFDKNDGLHLLELAGTSPDPYDPLNGAEMETQPAYKRRIDWGVGLFNLSQYCICRVCGFAMVTTAT